MRIQRYSFKRPLRQLQQAGRTSLQLRLTAGITTIALLGIGTIGTWTTWKMRKMLVVDHQDNVASIASRLKYKLSQAEIAEWPALVRKWSGQDTWVCVQPSQGERIIQANGRTDLTKMMAQIPSEQIPPKPMVETVNNYHLVLAQQPLKQSGNAVGTLYLAQDITHDYNVLSTLINTLQLAMLLALAAIVALIAMYVRESLRPLRRINQLAVSQAGQSQFALPAQTVPSEMEGVVQAMSSLSDRLSKTGERQRDFTNSLSHELRTSLCLIQGYLESTLRRGDNLNPTQREALEVAASEADRVVKLLRDLLDLGRINSGKLELNLQPVILNDLVDQAIQLVDPAQERSIEVTASPLVVAQADASQLSRVLVHLLRNACQYSKPDRPVQVTLQQTPQQAIVQVQDQGCGIPVTDQDRIFDPFYRVESSRCRSTGGMGLGLAIVKSLVETMGGEVSLASESGSGSTFTVTLPAVEQGVN
jgi:signal transduction histidine kinase